MKNVGALSVRVIPHLKCRIFWLGVFFIPAFDMENVEFDAKRD